MLAAFYARYALRELDTLWALKSNLNNKET